MGLFPMNVGGRGASADLPTTLNNISAQDVQTVNVTVKLPSTNPKIFIMVNNSGSSRGINSVASTNGYTVNMLSKTGPSNAGAACIAEIIGNSGSSVNLAITGSWTLLGAAYGWMP